jgi:hypothetical protein
MRGKERLSAPEKTRHYSPAFAVGKAGAAGCGFKLLFLFRSWGLDVPAALFALMFSAKGACL